MSAGRHERLRDLFDAIVDLPTSERVEAAARLCPDDDALRDEALRLCAQDDAATAAMLDAPPPGLEDLVESERPGDMIGSCRLIRRAGEGGFGVVYEAEQVEPIRRRVAIKLIKPGMDSREVLARFNAERQTLARLDHPGVAKVLAAGATPRARPYFVMDFIDGKPITDYCDSERCTIGERIGLFLQVCAPIEHAHQRGVIHRDIKPSNVLVVEADDGPSVRVIDFGIARALDDGPDRSRMTRAGQFVGTPAYMSPEQRAGDPTAVDTRSDVYALGVLLYELLTGERPFAGRHDTGITITPSRPSTRYFTRNAHTEEAATARGGRPADIGRALRGELDWIVLRAIEHEPTRRYASVGDLAADLRRHLRNEPVLARPPSRIYTARKFVARNRAAVAAAVVSVAALVAASVVSVSFAVSEAKQRRSAELALDVAERERRIARATSDFMTEGLIAAARPSELGHDVRMRDAARFAAERLDSFAALSDAPEVEATVRLAIANTLGTLGEGDTALAVATPAWEIRRALYGDLDERTLEARVGIGEAYRAMRRGEEALAVFREAHAAFSQTLGPDHWQTLWTLVHIGAALTGLAEDAAAEAALRTAIAGLERLGDEHAKHLYTARRTLQHLYGNMRRDEEAKRIAMEMVEQVGPLFGERSIEAATLSSMLATIAENEGRFGDAIENYSKAIAIRTELLGPEHGSLIEPHANRAIARYSAGRREEAFDDACEAARLSEQIFGVGSLEAVLSFSNALYIGAAIGRFEDAERYGLAAYEHAPGTRMSRGHVARNLATLYAEWEKAQPGKGYGEKAAQFLAEAEASTPRPTGAE